MAQSCDCSTPQVVVTHTLADVLWTPPVWLMDLPCCTTSPGHQQICHACNAPDAPWKCRCKSVFYCGEECAASDWKRHKCLCVTTVVKVLEKRQDQLSVENVDGFIMNAIKMAQRDGNQVAEIKLVDCLQCLWQIKYDGVSSQENSMFCRRRLSHVQQFRAYLLVK